MVKKIISMLMAIAISVSTLAPSTVYASEGEMTHPQKTGYTFQDWYDNPEFTGNPIRDKSVQVNGSDHYIKWSPNAVPYTIKHWTQDLSKEDEPTNNENYSLKEIESIMSISDAKVTPKLKEFEGFTAKSEEKDITVLADGSEKVNYYYTRNDYTVTLHKGKYIESVSGAGTYEYGEEVTINAVVKDGYKWNNWTGDLDSSIQEYKFEMPHNNVILTANGIVFSYDIEYNLNEGTLPEGSEMSYSEEKVVTLPTPIKTGYTFIGWYESNDYSGQKITSTSGMSGNKTFYAKWTPNEYTYNIVYKSSSGTQLGTSTAKYAYDTINTIIAKDFNGYTKPADQSVVWDKTTAKTITFTYTPIEYNVTIDCAGGSGVNSNKYTIETETFELGTPSRSGYTFTGWTGSNGSTPQTSVSIAKGSTGNKNYTANWSINSYTATFDANGGSAASPATITKDYNSAIGTLPTTSRTGYTFNGWYTAKTGGTKITTDTKVTTNVTYYAQWTVNEYTYNIVYKSSSGTQLGTATAKYAYGTTNEIVAKDFNGYTKPANQSVVWDNVNAKTITFTYTPIEYNVTIDCAGGSGVSNSKYTIETETFELGTPSRSGYTFTGWTGSNGSTPQTSVSIAKGSTDNKNYTANWSINSYTATFDANGGSAASPATITKDYNSAIGTLPTTSRTGYTFNGWYTAKTGGTKITTDTKVTTNVTYYAQWTVNEYTYNIVYKSSSGTQLGTATAKYAYGTTNEIVAKDFNGYTKPANQSVAWDNVNAKTIIFTYAPIEYSVTIDCAGGSGVNSSKYTIETATFSLGTPNRTGYTFTGWTGSNGSTPQTSVSIAKGSTGNKTYTANWSINSYTATFDANGGSAASPATITKDYNSAIGTLPTTSRTGYTFNGWYTAKTGGTKITVDTKVIANVTYYAQWTINQYYIDVNHTLDGSSLSNSLKNNVGTFDVYINGTQKSNDVGDFYTAFDYGTSYEVKDIKAMSGYTYTGQTTYSGTLGAAQKNVVLTWTTNSYDLTFNANGGTGTETKRTIKYNTAYGELPTASRTGYTFNGWYTAATGGTKVTSATVMSAANTTIYAQWTVNEYTYNIVYKSSSGTQLGTATAKYAYGTTNTINPKAFNGYTSPAAQSVKWDNVNAKTVTFTYTPIEYSVTIDCAGGSGVSSSKYTIETATFSLGKPSRTGYTFTGWTGSNGSTPQTSISIAKGSTGNKNYTANWSINSYTATFDANGGSAASPATIVKDYNSAIGTLPTTSRTGYTFNGWYTAKTGGTKITTDTKVTTNVTYYAQWTVNEYTYNIVYKSSSGTQLGTATTKYAYGTTNTINPKAFNGYTSPAAQSVKWDNINAKTITFTYTPISYSISYNLDGGTNPSGAATSYTIETAVTLPTPTKTGYVFVGWYTKSDFSDSAVTNITKGSTGNKTLYAKWGLPPGLYDENDNLIISWENSGIDVSVNYTSSNYKTSQTSGYYVTQTIYPDTRKVVMPTGVTSIGKYTFYKCTGLTSVVIGDDVTSIADRAFEQCEGLKEIVISDSVTNIGFFSFYKCTELAEIVIPDSVTSIKKNVFTDCYNLASIIVDDNNNYYHDGNGSNCIIETSSSKLISGCKNTVIPDSVTSIREYAFSGCTGLTSVVIPDSVTSIDQSAFENCTGLISVVIPDSVTSCAYNPFIGCGNLTSIIVDDNNNYYHDGNGSNCIIETSSSKLISGCKNTVIPDGVISIGSSAFFGCTGLTSIVIPDGVTSIGQTAFNKCTGLTSVVIGEGVTSIGTRAFFGCYGLRSAEFKDTENWYMGSSAVSSSDLANKSTAATQLTDYNSSWTKQ